MNALLNLAGKTLPAGLSADVTRNAMRQAVAERLPEEGRMRAQPFDAADLVEDVVEASGSSEASV